jgi:peroxiredoxin
MYKLAEDGKKKRKRLRTERDLSTSQIERNGIKPGTRAPEFTLEDVRGGTVSLQDYRGRRVLLVFTDPHCGPCDQLAPHLSQIHRQYGNNELAVVLVGRGDIAENHRKMEKYGLDCPFVVQERWKLSTDYGIFAAPVAFLIDEHGLVQQEVAKGVDHILMLALSR